MSRAPDLGLTGCLDVSVRTGPCASQVNGVCVGEGEEYVYIDNVAVDAGARRRGSASAMLEASSDVAVRWGAGFIYTHVHAENVAARRLYHAYGFRAPKDSDQGGDISGEGGAVVVAQAGWVGAAPRAAAAHAGGERKSGGGHRGLHLRGQVRRVRRVRVPSGQGLRPDAIRNAIRNAIGRARWVYSLSSHLEERFAPAPVRDEGDASAT